MAAFSDLVGKTLTKIDHDDDRLVFHTSDGDEYQMLHHQDCCENVYLEDVVGDLDDLIGSPILLAEERTEDAPGDRYGGISGWTFYALATIKGHVDLRWYGSSNGYYSIGVSFEKRYRRAA